MFQVLSSLILLNLNSFSTKILKLENGSAWFVKTFHTRPQAALGTMLSLNIYPIHSPTIARIVGRLLAQTRHLWNIRIVTIRSKSVSFCPWSWWINCEINYYLHLEFYCALFYFLILINFPDSRFWVHRSKPIGSICWEKPWWRKMAVHNL